MFKFLLRVAIRISPLGLKFKNAVAAGTLSVSGFMKMVDSPAALREFQLDLVKLTSLKPLPLEEYSPAFCSLLSRWGVQVKTAQAAALVSILLLGSGMLRVVRLKSGKPGLVAHV